MDSSSPDKERDSGSADNQTAEPGGAPPVRDNQVLPGASLDSTTISNLATANSKLATKPHPEVKHTEPKQSENGSTDHDAEPVARPSSGKPIGAVVTAIVIAVLLAALSVFAYLKTKNSAKPATDTSNTTINSTQPKATPEDVDKTNQDIDKSLNSIDSQDVNNNDLADPALGL